METSCLFTQITSCLVAVENQLGLLLALAILKDSLTIAVQTILHGTILDMALTQ